MTTVGVIGLGVIGGGVAGGLQRAGFDLTVCDVAAGALEPFAGVAEVASTPSELAARTDVVVVAVVDDDQARAVLEGPGGVFGAARPGTVVLLLSTVTPGTVRDLGEAARAAGVDLLDCGVSGGPSGAAKGSLVAMVGGDAEVVERVRPVLDGFTSLVVHMGPFGAGLQAKLARNVVQYGSWLAALEGQRLAEAAGIDLAKLAEVIRASDRQSGGVTALMFRDTVAPLGEDTDPGFLGAMRAASALAHKDLRAAIDFGGSLGLAMPVAELADGHRDDVFWVGTGAGGAP